MLPTEIITILSKYQNEVAEEISNINLAIEKIASELKSVSSVLVDELSSYAKNTGIKNTHKEKELLEDSIKLREYTSSIELIEYVRSNDKQSIKELDIYDIIVLNNTNVCSNGQHKTYDINVFIPVLDNLGQVKALPIVASYCQTCKRYTILKDDFKSIEGIIMCQVIDETATTKTKEYDEFDIEQKQSILYRYGYNVNSKQNLTSKQRHIILASVIEAGILNRRQILDHLTILIERGNKIPSWKEATDKWKQDRHYVKSYNTDNLPSVIFDKIILKYRNKKASEGDF